MEKEKTYWWWIETEIKFQNGWKEGPTLFFEAKHEYDARQKMFDETEDFLPDFQRMCGDFEGPYSSKENAIYFAHFRKRLRKTRV